MRLSEKWLSVHTVARAARGLARRWKRTTDNVTPALAQLSLGVPLAKPRVALFVTSPRRITGSGLSTAIAHAY